MCLLIYVGFLLEWIRNAGPRRYYWTRKKHTNVRIDIGHKVTRSHWFICCHVWSWLSLLRWDWFATIPTSHLAMRQQLVNGRYGALIITLGALFCLCAAALNVTIMMCGQHYVSLVLRLTTFSLPSFSRQKQQGTPLRALLISSTWPLFLLFNAS